MSWKAIKKITKPIEKVTKIAWDYSPPGMVYNLYDNYNDSVNAQKKAQKLAEQEYKNQLEEQQRIRKEQLAKRRDLLLQQRQAIGLKGSITSQPNQFTLLDNNETLG